MTLRTDHLQTSRRRFLQAGALGAFGLSLSGLWQAEAMAKAAGRSQARAKSCIFLFLWGGPSHIDTFDMKPEAPETRTFAGGLTVGIVVVVRLKD